MTRDIKFARKLIGNLPHHLIDISSLRGHPGPRAGDVERARRRATQPGAGARRGVVRRPGPGAPARGADPGPAAGVRAAAAR